MTSFVYISSFHYFSSLRNENTARIVSPQVPSSGVVSSCSQSSDSERSSNASTPPNNCYTDRYLNHNINAPLTYSQNAVMRQNAYVVPQSNAAFNVWNMPNMSFEQYKEQQLYREFLQTQSNSKS